MKKTEDYTVAEKVALLEGKDVWHTQSYDHLPTITMADGPHGLRKQQNDTDNLGIDGSKQATAFPTASLLACSFDREVVSLVARTIATEAISEDIDVVLGPGMNIKRSPLCGRNFEYFSEDPMLSGELAKAYVRAMEQEGVGSCVKHFICNNQENRRFSMNSIVDPKALHEIYLRGFEKAILEKPAMIMASYNKINGFYGTENPLLVEKIRNEYGYNGVIVSDWGAISNRIESLKATCDLEMPSSNGYSAKELEIASHTDEEISRQINESFERIATLARRKKRTKIEVDWNEHHQVAIRAASESIVLLKNNDVLPFKKEDKITLISGFNNHMRYQGGGSSHINPTKVEQLAAIAAMEYPNIKLATGFTLDKDGYDKELEEEALRCAKDADILWLVLGLPDAYETEGFDRTNLELPIGQTKLLEQCLTLEKKIVVTILAGSVVNLSFVDQVDGLFMAYLGGQGSARAIFDVAFGVANPSGRLAETFIDSISDCNVAPRDTNNATYYEESIYVGYRYYTTYEKKMRYPFGFGLSYTTFSYRDLAVSDESDRIKVVVFVKNTGLRFGKEVVQVYIKGPASTVYKPIRELKQFDKIGLAPGEEKEVVLYIVKKDLEVYNFESKSMELEQGAYDIQIGSNANEIVLSKSVVLTGKSIFYPPISYHSDDYDTSDFEDLFEEALPPKNIKKRRPYSLSSTLEDLESTVLGSLFSKMVRKIARKKAVSMEPWMREVMEKTIKTTPIRSLALFSGGAFSMDSAQIIIYVINNQFIKAIQHRKRRN